MKYSTVYEYVASEYTIKKEIIDELIKNRANIDELVTKETQEKYNTISEKGELYDVIKNIKLEQTALMYALSHNRGNSVKVLIECGADVNVKNFLGWTALHFAANRGGYDIYTRLVGAGANVNAENNKNETALMIAYKRDKYDDKTKFIEVNPKLYEEKYNDLDIMRKCDMLCKSVMFNDDNHFNTDKFNIDDLQLHVNYIIKFSHYYHDNRFSELLCKIIDVYKKYDYIIDYTSGYKDFEPFKIKLLQYIFITEHPDIVDLIFNKLPDHYIIHTKDSVKNFIKSRKNLGNNNLYPLDVIFNENNRYTDHDYNFVNDVEKDYRYEENPGYVIGCKINALELDEARPALINRLHYKVEKNDDINNAMINELSRRFNI